MSDKHPPTSPRNREAVLRYQAEQLLRDAATWGYTVTIEGPPSRVPVVSVIPCNLTPPDSPPATESPPG